MTVQDTDGELREEYHTYQELPLTPITSVTSARNRTGFWRTFRPVLDPEKCIKCYICWKFCPDVSVLVEKEGDYPEFDLEHCKGCGICARECPKDAITMILEADAP